MQNSDCGSSGGLDLEGVRLTERLTDAVVEVEVEKRRGEVKMDNETGEQHGQVKVSPKYHMNRY